MRFYTKEECESWFKGYGRDLDTLKQRENCVTAWCPPNPANIDFLWIAQNLSFREPILLWITEWGIWPSSENWHLYYKLRQSYGDQRLLHEAPGHLFQNFETDDLASFLQVAATNGWGGYILPASPYPPKAFFSHDEYIDFFDEVENNLNEVKEHFAHLIKPPSTFNSDSSRQRITQDGTILTPAELHPNSPE